MKRGVFYLVISMTIVICMVIFMLVSIFSTSEAKEAKRLFKDAKKLIDVAERIEKVDMNSAYELYKKAVTNVEKIISKYSSTQLANNLVNEDLKVGPFTVSELKDELLLEVETKVTSDKVAKLYPTSSEQRIAFSSTRLRECIFE